MLPLRRLPVAARVRAFMNNFAQKKTIEVSRGLFLIRYSDAEDDRLPPVVRIFPDPSSAADCQVIASPDSEGGTLWSPQSGLVIIATRPSRLIVEVSPQNRGGSTSANVKIEPLTPGTRPRPLVAAARPVVTTMSSSKEFQLLAHVAGVGDTTVGLDNWIAGPFAPSRIEGISIDWPGKPNDLDLKYAVKFARPHRADGKFFSLGTFAGTRGRALPLTGIIVEASGAAAARLNITVEAIFLGAPAVRVTGQHIDVAGPSRREPLVGLKINIEAAEAEGFDRPLEGAEPSRPNRSSGRVRVFRSRQSSSSSIS